MGSREAFVELLAGFARVLAFEGVSAAADEVIVVECDALHDVLLDSIYAVRGAGE